MTTFALFAALGTASVFLAAVVLGVWWFDRYDREPLPLVAAVFGWGVFAVPALVVSGSSVMLASMGGSPLGEGLASVAFYGPAVEELCKGLGILLVVRFSRHFDNPTDGLVYGTAVGLGFATTENLLAGFSTASAFGGGAWLDSVVARTFLTAGIHAVCSAVLGAGFGFAVLTGRLVRRWLWIFGAMLAAIAIHGGWNWFVVRFPLGTSGVEPWMLIVPLYVAFMLVLSVLLLAEQKILIRQLADEVSLGTVPEWAVDVIPYYRRRVRSDWWPVRRERTVISRLLTRLAFRKHAIACAGLGPKSIEGLEVVQLRKQARDMLSPPADMSDLD